VEQRAIEVPGLRRLTWQEVVDREYYPWEEEHIVIDTAGQTPEESLEALRRAL
jgi:hypothetical protein